MIAARQMGLGFSDLREMTLGMLMDYLTAYSNENISKNDVTYATQADIDTF